MYSSVVLKITGLTLAAALLNACGGGSGSNSGSDQGANSPETGSVSIGISDAPLPALSAVTITVDKITLNRPGDDIVIDSFTSSDLGITDADTFTLDLLEVQGMDNKIVVDLIELPVGDYQNLRVEVLDEDINLSYVDETDSGERKVIKVPSDELKLGGFTVTSEGVQTVMIEFGLRESMTYNPGPDRYILKPRGVRVVDVAAAAVIEGSIEVASFQADPGCMGVDPETGYAVYAYQGLGLDAAMLADSFDPDVEQSIDPQDMIAPFASTGIAVDEVSGNGSFMFPYFPAGDYMLAFSCDAEMDDPEQFEERVVPLPIDQLVEISLSAGDIKTCSFEAGLGVEC